MRRFFGFFIFLFGLVLSGWIAYNLLIERLPATAHTSPLPAIGLSLASLIVGFKWMKGRSA